MEDELYNRVEAFVLKRTAHPFVYPEARLFNDLGIDGVDREELMVEFAKEFGVDLDSFVLSRHFGPELPFNPLVWLYWKIFTPNSLNERGQYKMVPIMVSDLYEAAKTKRFPDLSNRPLE